MTNKQYLSMTGKLLLFLALSVLFSNANADLPKSFNATYALYYDDLRIGVMEREFIKNPDGTGTFTSKGKLTGLAALFKKDKIFETSRWKLVGNKLRPLEYSYEKSDEDEVKKERLVFDWNNKTTTTTTNDGEKTLPIEDGMLDKLLYQAAVMNGDDIHNDLEYRIVDKNEIKTYQFEFLGEEDLETPMGVFKTLKFQRKVADSKKSTTLWCAPDLQNLPVRVDVTNSKGNFTSIVIEKESGLSSNPSS